MFDGYDHSIISKRTFLPLQGFVLTLLGVLFFSVEPFIIHSNKTLFASVLMIALGLSIWGIIKLFIGNKSFVYLPTMSKIYFKEINFEHDKLSEIENNLLHGKYEFILKDSCSMDKGLKLSIAYSKDKEYAAFQIQKYIPFEYRPHSKIKELFNKDSNQLLNQVL